MYYAKYLKLIKLEQIYHLSISISQIIIYHLKLINIVPLLMFYLIKA